MYSPTFFADKSLPRSGYRSNSSNYLNSNLATSFNSGLNTVGLNNSYAINKGGDTRNLGPALTGLRWPCKYFLTFRLHYSTFHTRILTTASLFDFISCEIAKLEIRARQEVSNFFDDVTWLYGTSWFF